MTFSVVTARPVAWDSLDHRFPRGTMADFTRCPAFVDRCEELVPHRPIRFLDLGCSGGGIVLDFIERDHLAFGLEGSTYSQEHCRAAWGIIPEALRTADVGKPFQILEEGQPARFDVISAWEVLEHIATDDVPQLFINIRRHLAADGWFVGSVATCSDLDPDVGVDWHVTVKPKTWWHEMVQGAGLEPVDSPFRGGQYARGPDNPAYSTDWHGGGFYLVARRAS